jgi:hypothetical protein
MRRYTRVEPSCRSLESHLRNRIFQLLQQVFGAVLDIIFGAIAGAIG